MEHVGKRNPILSTAGAILLEPHPEDSRESIDEHSLVLAGLNSVFDLQQFKIPRRPLSLGKIPGHEALLLVEDRGVPRVTDLPIRFPGSNYRLPAELGQFESLVQRIANFESRINPRIHDEYYAYLTVHQGFVEAGARQRPSPCHVDGFQGARFPIKERCNHSYVISNAVPTNYYVQPFDLDQLDISKHNVFWELNRQVELANAVHVWQPEPYELILMDCYCVHRGAVAANRVWRTFVRISFEVRKFDHIDNTHNPLFAYDWPLEDRHIEKLGLTLWQPSS